ncbi:MAG: bifunctional enoyl-CoA hydratase/phosphate acetyltransferase [Betaproteobacteria bacterium]|nr:MAG: bifunctional enoyl-CoA hydratase/phosphate acetyltransferase [Betaproteobacteria bacterium]
MDDSRNFTFDEIVVGHSETLTRQLCVTEVEALAAPMKDGPTAPGAAAAALVSNLLLRRFPGPGSAIVETQLRYGGVIGVGDKLTVSVSARAKHADGHRVDFDCRCVNQQDATLVEGIAVVAAPPKSIAYSNVATPEILLRRNDGFAPLLRRCKALPPIRCAVVHPCDRDSLFGALEAAKRKMIVPVLVGPEKKIRAVASTENVDLTPYEIVSTEHSHAAAQKAVELARAGDVDALMKGSLPTDELMGAVVPTGTGLRTARRISHVFVIDVPTYPRLLLVTDAAINIAPDIEVKADIAQNAIDLARVLGIAKPKVAILSAVETVNPKIPSTVDAAALCKMADRGQITGGVLDGPLAFDNAISAAAAATKNIVSPVAGEADILLVPDLESGNILAKQLQYLAGADSAGIVLGTRVPIVLTSRADPVRTRLVSTAVMMLVVHSRRLAARPLV